MAIGYNPRIVTGGLVFCLDAGNTKSYPGSGTTWTDLSGQGKNGTLTNMDGTNFNSANVGSLTFNGSNEQVFISNSFSSTSLPTGSSSRTLIACFKGTSSFGGYKHILHYGTNSTDQSYGIAILNGYLNNHTWGGNSNFSNFALSLNQIYWVAVTYNDSATPRNRFFVNGTFGTTGYGQGKTSDYSINTGTSYGLAIGSRIANAEYFIGNVYLSMVYNRVLTDAEIQQNFNALRGRFGI